MNKTKLIRIKLSTLRALREEYKKKRTENTAEYFDRVIRHLLWYKSIKKS